MALADILRERVSRRGRTAQVDCGALGTVTVEALSPRECAALGMADGGRALLYAACRELQAAGETLRRERRLFSPDEVTAYVADGEARTAARTVLALSGVTPDEGAAESPDKSGEAERPDRTDEKTAETRLETVHETVQQMSEVRPETVQLPEDAPAKPPAEGENRLATVHETVQQMSEVRPGNVQFPEDAPADGQVSREFSGDGKSVRETPSVVAVSDFEPQNLALSEKNDDFMSPLELSGDNVELSGQMAGMHEITSELPVETAGTLHETEPEVPESLHEITSDFEEQAAPFLHESKSEIQPSVHESKSESAANGQQALHEMKSELRQPLHETESDFREGLHETKSEVDENRREGLHETTSELAEQVAARLLEGLRRAAAVR